MVLQMIQEKVGLSQYFREQVELRKVLVSYTDVNGIN